MTAKQYLLQAQALGRRIRADLEELRGLRLLITSAATAGYGGTCRTGGVSDPTAARVARLLALERRINAEIDTYVDFKDELREKIIAVGGECGLVLQYRYLSGLDWDSVAACLHRSRRSALYIHGAALKRFESLHSDSVGKIQLQVI